MSECIWGTAVFVILNSMTVYLVALIFVETFDDADADGT